MNRIILGILIFVCGTQRPLIAQDIETYNLFLKYNTLLNSGDFLKAEEKMDSVLDPRRNASEEYISAAYNNLGIVSLTLGNYDQALEYNLKAESIVSKKDQNSKEVADIFNNRGYIYNVKKSFDLAVQYLEKSIRIYLNLDQKDNDVLNHISLAYINISISYIETKRYLLALNYLERNVELHSKFKVSGISLTYLNIAKTYVKIGNFIKAEEFYHKCISSFIKESGDNYYRLVDAYFDYGLFLYSVRRSEESIEMFNKALTICIKNYGEKHTLVSLCYKLIGDHYKNQSDFATSLTYYQKSLIAVSKDFNDLDILSNPSIDFSLFDIRLLDNLKSKAQALELFAYKQNDQGMKIRYLKTGLETIELALELIDRIRNNYMSEESRIYLAENEKETYLFATHLAYSLYSISHDNSVGYEMYSIAQKAKAAILRNEITGNELLHSAGIPDSLRDNQNRLTGNIAAYTNFILEESRKTKPDTDKISLWKDAVFDMNREKDKVTADIEKVYPQYHDLLRKTEPLTLQNIQIALKKDETIVDYLVSNNYSDGKRRLYVFLISGKTLDFSELWLDSLFSKNAGIIRRTANPLNDGGSQGDNFYSYTCALNYMYLNLIRPVEELIKGNKLIIIPDEEIGWLPFDAFLKSVPGADQRDYEGLRYLINDYTFSYGYSSSLIFNKNRFLRGTKVFAFSPGYNDKSIQGNAVSGLKGADAEIGSILKRFKGHEYSGVNATKENFKTLLSEPAIFHLAMHSMPDSSNSKYSYLMFDTHNYSAEEAKLYNYEISLASIRSPMVVLSACNSGSGTLYSGEGLMSLARGFILAGASSVIKTSWEINDEVSAGIITNFYNYLSEGKGKNEAMRLAKLYYLKNSTPAFKNPFYWAAYEVLGDNSSIVRNISGYEVIAGLVLLLLAGTVSVYFIRRRIFSARVL
jgi:CHAT domain-containing protein/Tfp pilus assembly protein PilF